MAETVYFKPRQVAERIGTSPDRIIDLIHAGHMLGIDIRSPGARRATWRISSEALEDFIRRRSSHARVEKKPLRKQPYKATYY